MVVSISWGAFFVGVLMIGALLCGGYMDQAPDFWESPYRNSAEVLPGGLNVLLGAITILGLSTKQLVTLPLLLDATTDSLKAKENFKLAGLPHLSSACRVLASIPPSQNEAQIWFL